MNIPWKIYEVIKDVIYEDKHQGSIYTFSGKFPANLEHSQEAFFLVYFFVKPEILNCWPGTLEKRDHFAKGFFMKMPKF